MSRPVIEIYSSLDCPYAYLATYRLRQLWPDVAGRVRLAWRTLSLEYVNERPVSKPLLDAERPLFAKIEPQLPWEPWQAAEWNWPTTMWPAHEALACAQVQGAAAAFTMSWALRHAFFAQSKNVALRHEILAVARRVAKEGTLDPEQLTADWDAGRYKQTVVDESRRGWHDLQLNGSATFVRPDGRRVTNPALGEVDFDEENYVLRAYKPYDGDTMERYRTLLESVAKAGGPEPEDKMKP